MSNSESDLSDVKQPLPSDARIEKALRNVVLSSFKGEEQGELSLRGVRNEVVQILRLPDGFLKSDAKWNKKSKQIVSDEVSKQEELSIEPASSPLKKASNRPIKPAKEESKTKKRPAKQPPAEDKPKARKRLKKAVPSSPSSRSSSPTQSTRDADDQANKSPSSPPSDAKIPQEQTRRDDDLGNDSDLSDVKDDSPPPKKQRKTGAVKNTTSAKESTAKAVPKGRLSSGGTPQDEEIKRLQGQLVKCGVRKLWGKELASLDTPKQKISHLKRMLEEAGMTGRFSDEKARQIKEARELRADLDAIKEGDEKWGLDEEQPRRRRLASRPIPKPQPVLSDEESEGEKNGSGSEDEASADGEEDSEGDDDGSGASDEESSVADLTSDDD